MREIKFRAWDEFTKTYLETGFHVFGEVTCFDLIGMHINDTIKERGKDRLECYNDITIEQYTGLHDKNGREIYEGDIVHADYSEWHWDAVVEWDTINPCFMMNKIGGNPSWEYDFNKCDQMVLEVIGNIHETPELLK